MNKWIDTRDCTPLTDGEYFIQTIYGEVVSMNYTTDGGWNTHRDGDTLYAEKAINDGYVVRWYMAEPPQPVPEEWKAEYKERRKKCATE